SPLSGGTAGNISMYAVGKLSLSQNSAIGGANAANNVQLLPMTGLASGTAILGAGSSLTMQGAGSITVVGAIDLSSASANGGSFTVTAGSGSGNTISLGTVNTTGNAL